MLLVVLIILTTLGYIYIYTCVLKGEYVVCIIQAVGRTYILAVRCSLAISLWQWIHPSVWAAIEDKRRAERMKRWLCYPCIVMIIVRTHIYLSSKSAFSSKFFFFNVNLSYDSWQLCARVNASSDHMQWYGSMQPYYSVSSDYFSFLFFLFIYLFYKKFRLIIVGS